MAGARRCAGWVGSDILASRSAVAGRSLHRARRGMPLQAQDWVRGLGVAEGVDLHAMRTYRRLRGSSGDYLGDACFEGGFGWQKTRRVDVDGKKELCSPCPMVVAGWKAGNAQRAPVRLEPRRRL